MATPASEDLQAFRNFEQTGWDSTSGKYDSHFGRLTPNFAENLLDGAKVGESTRVLDIATGPGYVAAAATSRGADAVGVDFAPGMLAEAHRLHPNVCFQEGDAEVLPFDDESFDAVVISFGMLHFARPEVVLSEVWRVLRPGGRFAFTVWGNPEQAASGTGILLRAIETHGTMDVGLPPGPPMFRFSDHNESRRTLLEAGFVDPDTIDLPHVWELTSPDGLIEAFKEAGVRAGEILRSQEPGALEAITGFVRNAVRTYERSGTFAVPMGAVLVQATKPM